MWNCALIMTGIAICIYGTWRLNESVLNCVWVQGSVAWGPRGDEQRSISSARWLLFFFLRGCDCAFFTAVTSTSTHVCTALETLVYNPQESLWKNLWIVFAKVGVVRKKRYSVMLEKKEKRQKGTDGETTMETETRRETWQTDKK